MNEPSLIADIIASVLIFGFPSLYLIKLMRSGGVRTVRKFQNDTKKNGPSATTTSLELASLATGNVAGVVGAEVLMKAPPRAVSAILMGALIILNIAIPLSLSVGEVTPRELPALLLAYVAAIPFIFLLVQQKRKKINDTDPHASGFVIAWALSLFVLVLVALMF